MNFVTRQASSHLGVVDSDGVIRPLFISETGNGYASNGCQCEDCKSDSSGSDELPHFGWLGQLLIDIVCVAWWLTLMGIGAFVISVPVLIVTLLVLN